MIYEPKNPYDHHGTYLGITKECRLGNNPDTIMSFTKQRVSCCASLKPAPWDRLSCGYNCDNLHECWDKLSKQGEYGWCDASEDVFRPSETTVVVGVEGAWVPIHSSSDSGTFSITTGSKFATTVKETSTYMTEVSKTLEEGSSFWVSIGVLGYVQSSSKRIGTRTSMTLSTTYVTQFEEYQETTISWNFKPGVTWQWEFSITDGCGEVSKVRTSDIVTTANRAEPPCCLPHYFKNPNSPYGECVINEDGELISFCEGMQDDAATPNATDPREMGPRASCPLDAPEPNNIRGRYGEHPPKEESPATRADRYMGMAAMALLALLS